MKTKTYRERLDLATAHDYLTMAREKLANTNEPVLTLKLGALIQLLAMAKEATRNDVP